MSAYQRVGVVGLVAVLAVACGKSARDRAAGARGGSSGEGGEGGTEQCTTTNPCLRSQLDEAEGRCVTTPRAGSCDDGDACTSNDQCDADECSGEPRDCDDSLGCTLDRCEPGLGCVHETDEALCNDGNDCTLDQCSASGECTNEAASGNVCGDSDCVAEAVCDEGECVSQPVDSAGVCYPESVDFGDVIVGMTEERDLVLEAAEGAFTVESVESLHSDVAADPPSLPNTVDEGESLAVALAWTPSAEGALDSRVQVHTDSVTWHVSVVGRALPQPDCDDDDPCTADAFDTTLGECVNEVDEDATCDDGDPCTMDDRCDAAGACASGDYLECPTGQVCKQGQCAERLCLRTELLSANCATYAAPLGEGCLCELIHSVANSEIQARIGSILATPDYDQQIIVSTLLAQLLVEGWNLRIGSNEPGPQSRTLEQIGRWDIGMVFSVSGVSRQAGVLTNASNRGDTMVLFQEYEALAQLSNLATVTDILNAHSFGSDLDDFRMIGLAETGPRLIDRLLAADPNDLGPIVARLRQAVTERNNIEVRFVAEGLLP
jgi:hypothetical protein